MTVSIPSQAGILLAGGGRWFLEATSKLVSIPSQAGILLADGKSTVISVAARGLNTLTGGHPLAAGL